MNISSQVSNQFPVIGVSGAAVSELDNELYMARFASSATDPGEVLSTILIFFFKK